MLETVQGHEEAAVCVYVWVATEYKEHNFSIFRYLLEHSSATVYLIIHLQLHSNLWYFELYENSVGKLI